MATLPPFSVIPASSRQKTPAPCRCVKLPWSLRTSISGFPRPTTSTIVRATLAQKNALEYRKLGDSDLNFSEITLELQCTAIPNDLLLPFFECSHMTFGEQNTEKEAHDMLSYAFGHGINALDTAEMYPVPMKQETQGRTDLYTGSWPKSQSRDKIILATEVSGYTEQLTYLRDNAKVVRVDALNLKERVEKSLKRLGTDYEAIWG